MAIKKGAQQNTKYKFEAGGNVRIQINQDKSIYDAMVPWSSSIGLPDAALVVQDITPASLSKSKQDIQYDGEVLTKEEKLWLGTVYDLTRVSILASRSRWIVMPIHDISQRVGFKAVDMLGTRPGQRMALAIERDDIRLNTSDAELLSDVWGAVDHCISQLRRKEIYRSMREQALAKFTHFLQAAAKRSDSYDDEEVNKWIYDAVQTCCPGVLMYTASVSSDLKSLKYTMFDLSGSQRNFTIYEGQGSEWEFIGRHPPKSSVVRSTHDFQVRSVAAYRPLPNTNFPRFLVPLAAGDMSLGFFGVENFNIHKGNVDDAITDEAEIRKWFEDIGALCGDAMYTGREKRSLRDIESYTLGWGSSSDGVVVEILRTCMGVIQGCKLMEVWSIDKNNHIQSLSAQSPIAQPLPGRRVTIQQMKLRVLGGQGLKAIVKALQSKSINVDESMKNDSDKAEDEDESLMSKAQIAAKKEREAERIAAMENRSITFLLGLRYDNVEQSKVFKMKENEIRTTVELNIPIVLTHDRNITVSLYHVTPDLKILQDWSGRISFTTFAETSLKTSISQYKAFSSNFDCEFVTQWPEIVCGERRFDIDLKQIKLFNVTIKHARDLKPCDGDVSNPFCEVFYGEEMIGKSKNTEKTLNPTFDDNFVIGFAGKQAPLIIDMYDLGLFGKGSFMGRVEVPFDLLCTPPPGDFEYPLKMKSKLNAKKQEKVGGMLTMEYSIEMKKQEAVVDSKAMAAVDLLSLDIPRNVWGMKAPALNLTINACTNLAKANLFGGSSDPFVVVYVEHNKKSSDEPVFKTKFIENNLNPVWNETFLVNLGTNMEQGVTTAKDFPTIRLEVYDYNRLMKGELLGTCEIGPAVYFQRKAGEFKLQPSKKLNARKNKLVQGDLSATFFLQDSIVGSLSSIDNFKFSPLGTLYGQSICEVHIVKAKNLMVAKRMTGKSDPYVVVRWGGKDYGETTTKKGTLDPSWSNEKFVVPIAEAGNSIPDLTLEVWDRDFFTGGSFMGEVVISGDVLLHPATNDTIESPLKNKSDEAPNAKIKGMLTYRLVHNRLPQRLQFSPKDYIEVKAPKASPFTAQDIRIIKDPESEEKRQKFEKLNLPSIIKKAKADTDKYLSHPFERTGLISELHFGQVVSACDRASHTILKTDKSDIFVLPINRMSADGKKEEPHTAVAKKLKLGEVAPIPDREPIMCLVARYDNSKLPRRDIQFLQKFQDVLMRGLKISTKREARTALRATLEKNMSAMHHAADVAIANDVLIAGISEIELGLSCKVDFYALMPDSKSFYECPRARGNPDYNSPKANDFINLATRLCRHGIMIQLFRGKMQLVDWDWTGVSQMALIDIDTVAEAIDTIEGDGFVQSLKEQGKIYSPNGSMIFPLLDSGEPMLAMAQVHDLDNLPYAAYRVKPLGARRKVKAGDPNAKRKIKEFEEIFGPEDGVISVLRNSAKALGGSLVAGRLNDCVKKMKNFEITPRTTMEDILRHTFTLLVLAIPAIRNISIWGVDFEKQASANKGKVAKKRKNFIDQLKELLGLGPKIVETESAVEENSSFHGFPEILCGFFGDELADNVMANHLRAIRGNTQIVEKKTLTKDIDGKTQIVTGRVSIKEKSRRSSNISSNALSRHRSRLDETAVPSNWILSIPAVFQNQSSVGEIVTEALPTPSPTAEVKTTANIAESKPRKSFAGSKPPAEAKQSKITESENEDDDNDTQTNEPKSALNQLRADAKTSLKPTTETNFVKDIDISQFSNARIERILGPIDRHAMLLSHAECIRCINDLKQKSFQVASGHLLGQCGIDEEAKSEFNNLFGIKDLLKIQNDEREKKEAEVLEKELKKTETLREWDAMQREITDTYQKLLDEQEKEADLATEELVEKQKQSKAVLTTFTEDNEEDEDDEENPSSSAKQSAPHISPRGQGVIGIAGTSNVKPNLPKGMAQDANGNVVMDPNRPKAPLPAGPAPSVLSPRSIQTAPRGSEAALAALAKLKEKEAALKSKMDALKETTEEKNEDEDEMKIAAIDNNRKSKQPKLTFFLTVNTHGIGGEDGWGELGHSVSQGMQQICKEIDNTVNRMFKVRRFAEKEAKERAEKAEAKRLEEEAAAEVERQKERAAKEEKRRLRELKRKEAASRGSDSENSDSSAGSGSSKGSSRRRSSISRKASVSRKSRKSSASS